MSVEWVTKKTWEEFRKIGLLWFVNRILHLFGWVICFDYDKDKDGKLTKIKEVFPARTKFRGFYPKDESAGFINVTKYLKENIDELVKETKE